MKLFKACLDSEDGALGRAERFNTLEEIGDKHVAAAIADVYWRTGGGAKAVRYNLQGAINAVLASDPSLSETLLQLLQSKGELSSSQLSGSAEDFQLAADGRFGKQSLRAVQLIVKDEAARRSLLDAIADRRTQWHLDHLELYPGDPSYDIDKRYPHFRFQ